MASLQAELWLMSFNRGCRWDEVASGWG